MACALATALLAALVVTSAPAFAATGVAGGIGSAVQARDGSTTVVGWAYDRAHPAQSITVCVWSSNHCRKLVTANLRRADIDSRYKITGWHGFRVTLPRSVVGRIVTVRLPNSARPPIIAARFVSTPGARIVAVARTYVGRSPYVEGGASPRGFDCSGYSMYAYARGRVAGLPHNAEAQRHAAYMHQISSSRARPGDLVFYMSGGAAYHVAIYAGHGKQYSAATPSDGLVYQSVWSSAVQYRTDWH